MDRIEPYIGMPIILGDDGMQNSGGTAAQTRASMQEARVAAGSTRCSCSAPQPAPPGKPEDQMPPERPETPEQPEGPEMPELPENGQNGCQPCLKDRNCDCGTSVPQQVMMPAMAYVPWQKWKQPYEYTKGFETGTIFPELDLPFSGYRGGRRR